MAITGPAITSSGRPSEDIQWLPTTISIICGEPKCACNACKKKSTGSYPAMEGQIHLMGETQYVRALGK